MLVKERLEIHVNNTLFRTVALLLLSATFLGACASSGGSSSTTPEEAFERGRRSFERGRYSRAIEQLQSVFEYGRAHEWADDTQFLLAESYFMTEQYLLSATEYDRFAQLYPSDERTEEAEYKRALSYYRLSPPYQLDQSDTERAISNLRLFVGKYPQSERSADIGRMIDELLEKLARKRVEAARMYARQKQFLAAALTYESVLADYPNTEWADDALLEAMQAYLAYAEASIAARKAERISKAIDAYNQLVQLFPGSELLKEAEAIYDDAARQLEELGVETGGT
jgi:outer membrane protein assembly factor BamD